MNHEMQTGDYIPVCIFVNAGLHGKGVYDPDYYYWIWKYRQV